MMNGLNFPLKLFLPFTSNRLYNTEEFKEEIILQFLRLVLWNFVGILYQNYIELLNGNN